eukprot:1835868-Amphidinium_carterae.1
MPQGCRAGRGKSKRVLSPAPVAEAMAGHDAWNNWHTPLARWGGRSGAPLPTTPRAAGSQASRGTYSSS